MNRRSFLRNGSLLIPAVIGGLVTNLPIKLLGKTKGKTAFSLSVITDTPTVAINEIGNAIRFSKYKTLNIDFSEHQLIGEHISDLALVENGSLINYFKSIDEFSTNLKKIASKFSFPQKVVNPTLLLFSAGDSGQPEYFNVSVSNRLVRRIPINSPNGIYKIDGVKGNIEMEIIGKSAKIHSSSCKHKTCIGMGEIKNSGESLVCIPSRISISVSGKSNSIIDSVTF